MRESVGGTWLFGVVITFVIIFTSFLAIAISYTRAFQTKNEILLMIEKKRGVTLSTDEGDALNWGSIQLINNYIDKTNYEVTGKCPAGEYYVYQNNSLVKYQDGDYPYCLKKVKVKAGVYYYDLVMFYKINIPIINSFFTFKITGQTNEIVYPVDNLES